MRRTLLSGSQLADTNSERLLRDIHKTLGSNIESDALSTLAEQPDDLANFWSAIGPAIQRSIIRSASDEVRRTADGIVRKHVTLPNHLSWIASKGWSREDSRQIRYVVEAFYNLEPVFAMLASTAAKWAKSGSFGSWTIPQVGNHDQTPACFAGRINFSAPAPGKKATGSVLDDQENPTHPLARALMVWPGYMRKALGDLESVPHKENLREAMVMLHATIDLLTAHLPVSIGAPVGHRTALVERMKLCLAASLEATVIACALRRGFVKAEISARNERIGATAP